MGIGSGSEDRDDVKAAIAERYRIPLDTLDEILALERSFPEIAQDGPSQELERRVVAIAAALAERSRNADRER